MKIIIDDNFADITIKYEGKEQILMFLWNLDLGLKMTMGLVG